MLYEMVYSMWTAIHIPAINLSDAEEARLTMCLLVYY